MSRPIDHATACIRGGSAPRGDDPAWGALLPPIYQTTTFRHAAVGEDQTYSYSRVGNPTVDVLEARLGALEGAGPALAFGTGLAATTTLCLGLLRAGDRVVCSDVVYGGTFRLLREVLAGLGVASEFVDTTDPENLAAALRAPARLVILESPANPTLKLTDIAACTAVAHARGALVVVDNTFLTPVLQQPLDLGADLTLCSTTKYVDGHNATVGGAVCTHDPELRERLRLLRTALGTIQTPHNAWLTLQGLKTLPLRLARQGESALRIATVLRDDPRVERVLYPGLPDFPQRDLATRQQRGGGGLVSFEVAGGEAAAAAVLRRLRLVTPAENLGAVESLATHPATMTHRCVPAEIRAALGVTDGLIRLSVGLEDPDAIIADLDRALGALATNPTTPCRKEARHA